MLPHGLLLQSYCQIPGQRFTVQCARHCLNGAGWVVYMWSVSNIWFWFQNNTVPIYGNPRQSGVLGPYEDTSSICRACIKSGVGTNDDSFYCSFTIASPVPFYKDPGGGSMRSASFALMDGLIAYRELTCSISQLGAMACSRQPWFVPKLQRSMEQPQSWPTEFLLQLFPLLF